MKRALSLLMVLALLVGLMPMAALASENTGEDGSAASTVVDVDSRYDYQKIFDLDNTRYDGRIWTDKTVAGGDIIYTGNVREQDGS